MTKHSIIPRPHPLTKKNALVTQVELLGLVDAFTAATFKTFCRQPAQKKSTDTQISPKKFDFIHQTVSHWEACTG